MRFEQLASANVKRGFSDDIRAMANAIFADFIGVMPIYGPNI